MSITTQFIDGITHLSNMLLNSRTADQTNYITEDIVEIDELNSIYKTGIGNRIVNVKVNTAFKEGLIASEKTLKEIKRLKLMPLIRKACRFQLAFGRSLLFVIEKNVDPSEPLTKSVNLQTVKFRTFEGYDISCSEIDIDVLSERFMKPNFYNVRGVLIHYSRVIDFKYIAPIDVDAPQYNYGGISEYELIYKQLINDGVVERTTPLTVERGATIYYKVKGFKQALQTGKEKDILKFYSAVESMRNIAGAVVTDAEDQIEVKNQTVQNLDVADRITLRRLALVTGIPLKFLMGENFTSQGLGANSRTEDDVFNSMIKNLQDNHFVAPINELLKMIGLEEIEGFNKPQELNMVEHAKFETDVLRNADSLERLGGDAKQYLIDNGFQDYYKEVEEEFDDLLGDDEDDDNLDIDQET